MHDIGNALSAVAKKRKKEKERRTRRGDVSS